MMRYGWYTRIIQEELRKRVNQYMEENGGIPDGNLKAIIRITLDSEGNILDFAISDSSGNDQMDAAVLASLRTTKISEAPPEDMPKTIKLKISAKG
jgi:TonB family protein